MKGHITGKSQIYNTVSKSRDLTPTVVEISLNKKGFVNTKFSKNTLQMYFVSPLRV